MNKKRNLWIVFGGLLLLAVVVSGFVLLQPTAEEILTQAIEKTETITSAHAVVDLNIVTPDKNVSATVEVWGRRDAEKLGAFRLEVLDASEAKAVGGLVVSNGTSLWAYAPVENKVFTGTVEDAKAWLAEKDLFRYEMDNPDSTHTHPETAEEAVQLLLKYFSAGRDGTEQVSNETAYHLKLHPIPEQMPPEFAAVGGLVNLWIGTESQTLLGAEYTGGTLGEGSAMVLEMDLNPDLANSLFAFEIPPDAEVITLADLEPQSLTLDEAVYLADFELLAPVETPEGATLVDVLEIGGGIIQRYALPDGGSFSVAQGTLNDITQPPSEGQAVEVRGATGMLYTSEDGNQAMLTWSENGLDYIIAGNLTSDQALRIAESLE